VSAAPGARSGAVGLLALVVLSGCSGGSARTAAGHSGSERGEGVPVTTRVQQYAALGDSYTSAPFVPVTDLAGGCLRSDSNYPQLVGAALGATVTDVSCGAATTEDLTSPQSVGGGRGTVPAQVRAVQPGTDLVTVSIGGNDGGLFARLAVQCVGADQRPQRRCGGLAGALRDAGRVIDQTGRRVADALRAVADVAPRAVVLLVGYPRLADPARSCAGLPLSAPDRTAVSRLEGRLDAALRRAADAADARFLDVRGLSRGHEVCSADPWVNGGRTDPGRALAFHPFAVEQQAVADAIVDLLAEDG
jgi:lysophospholipase L1-like esterase